MLENFNGFLDSEISVVNVLLHLCALQRNVVFFLENHQYGYNN